MCGIITAKRLLYHAHIASPRRCAEISWRAVADGTCQLYHKARNALWYNHFKMNASVHFGYGGRLPPIAAAQSMRPGNEFPVAWRFSACGYGAVSYTHLDVYKRQGQILSARALLPRRGSARGPSAGVYAGGSVSYTHLSRPSTAARG